MECTICHVIKLPNEFPSCTVTEDCDHPYLACLRCTIKHVGETSRCPHPGCGLPASLSDPRIKMFQTTLRYMFREYTPNTESPGEPEAIGGTLTVSQLTGDSVRLPFSGSMTVRDLKRKIYMEMKHDVDKQKLLYNDVELTDYRSDGGMSRLSDFNVMPNSNLCLIILLFAVPTGFDHVVFDLYWGYPGRGRDYLDASCLVFSGQSFQDVCDYGHRNGWNSYIHHSGDVMDDISRTGHHTINVKLKLIPQSVTHLFFTLSAWSSPNISMYPNPSLKFYEAAKPSVDLCKTTFTHARNSRAVIMCSLSRGTDGQWRIYESGKLSAGNARNYNRLKETVRSLIAQGF